jgi:hypothetical protein
MKPGDLVRVIDHSIRESEPQVWNDFMGECGVIISMAKRLHIPAAKLMIKGEVAEFDLEELEVINESR